MAADILTYRATYVPVGEDQKQHLELTRDLAGAFNRCYKKEYFKLPDPMILNGVKRIMSLQDGTSKMSKSDESDLSRINLEDSPELIVKKIKMAKTDSEAVISFDDSRPEICNLLNIFSAVTGKEPEDLAKEYENSGFGKFKGDLAENVVSCNGYADGRLTITPSGGTKPYTYTWNTINGVDSIADSLLAGSYSVSITDINNCLADTTYLVAEPTKVALDSMSIIPITCNNAIKTCFSDSRHARHKLKKVYLLLKNRF